MNWNPQTFVDMRKCKAFKVHPQCTVGVYMHFYAIHIAEFGHRVGGEDKQKLQSQVNHQREHCHDVWNKAIFYPALKGIHWLWTILFPFMTHHINFLCFQQSDFTFQVIWLYYCLQDAFQQGMQSSVDIFCVSMEMPSSRRRLKHVNKRVSKLMSRRHNLPWPHVASWNNSRKRVDCFTGPVCTLLLWDACCFLFLCQYI